MSLIAQEINRKLESLNDNGKARLLFELIEHCLQQLPNMTAVSLKSEKERIEQLVNLLKFILLSDNARLEGLNTAELSTLNHLMVQNRCLAADIRLKQEELQMAGLDRQDLLATANALQRIQELVDDTGCSVTLLVGMANRFRHLELLAEHLSELHDLQEHCRTALAELTTRVNRLVTEKQKMETSIRDKINETN